MKSVYNLRLYIYHPHMIVWEGNVFSISVCPQGRGAVPIVPDFATRCQQVQRVPVRCQVWCLVQCQVWGRVEYVRVSPWTFWQIKLAKKFGKNLGHDQAGGVSGTPLAVTQENFLVPYSSRLLNDAVYSCTVFGITLIQILDVLHVGNGRIIDEFSQNDFRWIQWHD